MAEAQSDLTRKVYVTPGDGIRWAVDDDRKQIVAALTGVVQLVDLPEAEAVHAVWWEQLDRIWSSCRGKRILCQLTGEPERCFTLRRFCRIVDRVGLWIAPSQQALRQMQGRGCPVALVPYTVDTGLFRKVSVEELAIFRTSLSGLPTTKKYLIGSFQRDTEGCDLTSPKLCKGPDIFAEICGQLYRRGQPIHVVLAGPRRMWLLRELRKHGVPVTYVGEERGPGKDDLHVNTLDRRTLNLLYNLVDLYLVSSRSEGGPKAILEASAAGTPIFSTRVGQAADVLPPECLYVDAREAVAIIEEDIAGKTLGSLPRAANAAIRERHTVASARMLYEEVYRTLDSLPVYR